MLPMCNHVDMIEYVPSTRLSKRCHYYDNLEDKGCTFGAWHPLAAEKLLALSMSSSDENEIFGRGVLRIQGYPSLKCWSSTQRSHNQLLLMLALISYCYWILNLAFSRQRQLCKGLCQILYLILYFRIVQISSYEIMQSTIVCNLVIIMWWMKCHTNCCK